MVRLQKYMADCAVASRRACEEIISAGRVTVNGTTATLGQSVDPERDRVAVDGKPIRLQRKRVVIMLYKPRGVVSTSEDERGRKTVQEYFKELPYRLYNVGRLDLNSEGLLLMTNDGELANKLMHPRYGVTKTYRVVCDGTLSASEIASLTNGVELEDGMTAPAKVTNIRRSTTGGTAFSITIHEGRNRQIRRMLEAVGHKTLRLKREAYGPLQLGSMKPGEWRYLYDGEIEALKEQADR
ncbi:MAG: rRNA pseudouridine synthase [Clostridia bacterium]|nr:rRNA pseudouridine synthase [Clostridia bacterium]